MSASWCPCQGGQRMKMSPLVLCSARQRKGISSGLSAHSGFHRMCCYQASSPTCRMGSLMGAASASLSPPTRLDHLGQGCEGGVLISGCSISEVELFPMACCCCWPHTSSAGPSVSWCRSAVQEGMLVGRGLPALPGIRLGVLGDLAVCSTAPLFPCSPWQP